MPHFKAPDNSIHFLDPADIARGEIRDEEGGIVASTALALLPAGCIEISDDEAEQLRNPIESVRAERWEAIKAERDRRAQQGGYQVGGSWFHSDLFSRTQQLGLKTLGQDVPAGLKWKTMSGEFVTMTPALAEQVFAAATASDIAIFAAAEAHKAAMLATADPASYDFSGGWPAAFGD